MKNYLKNLLLIANLFIIIGVVIFLLTSFKSERNSYATLRQPLDFAQGRPQGSVSADEIKKWHWEEMYPDDMREALETMPVAWVLFSPLEWHGEAMSFGTDPMIGQHVVDKAWSKVGGVRIPTMLVGAETDYKYWGQGGLKSHWGLETITKDHNYGSLYIRSSTLQMIIEDYVYFLKREGFKLAILSTGHGAIEHVKVMKEVCERYTDDGFRAVFLPYWGSPSYSTNHVPEELKFEGSGGHADYSELSLLGAVDPNMVDIDKFGTTEADRKVKLLKENKDKIDFEKAKKLMDFYSDALAEKVQELVDEMEK